MRITESLCSWCHTMSSSERCEHCGHNAFVARMHCDCPRCNARHLAGPRLSQSDASKDRRGSTE